MAAEPGVLRVAGIQHDIAWEQPGANFDRLDPLVDKAVGAGARLVALTEMYSYGFSMSTDRIAEPVDGPSTRFLVERARTHGVWLCGSVPERPEGQRQPHNCLVLAGPDGQVHRYRKIHRFSFAGENEHYEGGSEMVTVAVEGVRTSLFVCFDLRFAPDFWGRAHDTDLYVVVANWPAARSSHWTTLLRARAIENQAYVLGLNRVGAAGDGLEHSGDSRLFDPLGEVVASAPAGEESLVVGDVDPALVARVRRDYPFLDERTDPPR